MEKHSVEAIVMRAVASLERLDLRRLKQRAGRPQDLLDLEKLKSLDTEMCDE